MCLNIATLYSASSYNVIVSSFAPAPTASEFAAVHSKKVRTDVPSNGSSVGSRDDQFSNGPTAFGSSIPSAHAATRGASCITIAPACCALQEVDSGGVAPQIRVRGGLSSQRAPHGIGKEKNNGRIKRLRICRICHSQLRKRIHIHAHTQTPGHAHNICTHTHT